MHKFKFKEIKNSFSTFLELKGNLMTIFKTVIQKHQLRFKRILSNLFKLFVTITI